MCSAPRPPAPGLLFQRTLMKPKNEHTLCPMLQNGVTRVTAVTNG